MRLSGVEPCHSLLRGGTVKSKDEKRGLRIVAKQRRFGFLVRDSYLSPDPGAWFLVDQSKGRMGGCRAILSNVIQEGSKAHSLQVTATPYTALF